MSKIITRFAPSPTGKAHAGGYRTAMYAWLFARQNNGKFILRIEDTDKARNQEGAREDIFEALEWLGIKHDEMFIQSENLERHKEILNYLIKEDKAYLSHEESRDGSGDMKDVVRFRNPGKIITFTDLIRGAVTIDTTDLGDFVLARTINDPVYHLAAIVDDHDEGVTHVIRAEEHISNTPRHILIMEALGWDVPQYAHLPLVLTADKKKLSKRKGALAMTDYAKMGYLPEAVFNCIVMLGWNPADPGSEQEVFSIPELIKRFDFERMQKSGAVFNPEKLNWFNREYIKQLSDNEKKEWVLKFLPEQLKNLADEMLDKLIPTIVERIDYFGQITELAQQGEYDYFISQPIIDLEKLTWKIDTLDQTKAHLQEITKLLQDYSDPWTHDGVKSVIWDYAESVGRGSVLWPMRFALSGREKSPDPFTLAEIFGKIETLKRIDKVINML